ncbi:hypothetical protein Hanom_Chr08g00705631 [Helianthus anomalus]
MHNVQHLKHQETQTIYPSNGSSSVVHFSHFFTRIVICTTDIQFTFSIAFSLTTHTSHKTSSDLFSLSATQEHHARSLTRCRFMTRSMRISSWC